MKDRKKANEEIMIKFLESSGSLDRIRQKGLQEGLQKGAMEVISLLKKGYSPDDIKKMMQLT